MTRNELQMWNPFRELDSMHRRMSQMLETAFEPSALNGLTGWTPPVDIEETDDAFVIEAELPGVKRDDVSVELDDNELTIRGESKERERVGILRRQSRRVGEFHYRVRLPGDVDEDKVEATLRDGVLELRVGKAVPAKARQIEISAG
ncbi:MAG TPA: Hsp20/alpha crystallin family protein [Beutenbergiaceae bacterium]|nr:Hsp20/alpha crystallin family protein [Beutenbergiaceae bacterium]